MLTEADVTFIKEVYDRLIEYQCKNQEELVGAAMQVIIKLIKAYNTLVEECENVSES